MEILINTILCKDCDSVLINNYILYNYSFYDFKDVIMEMQFCVIIENSWKGVIY